MTLSGVCRIDRSALWHSTKADRPLCYGPNRTTDAQQTTTPGSSGPSFPNSLDPFVDQASSCISICNAASKTASLRGGRYLPIQLPITTKKRVSNAARDEASRLRHLNQVTQAINRCGPVLFRTIRNAETGLHALPPANRLPIRSRSRRNRPLLVMSPDPEATILS
jgi:hypothetical protein